MPDRRPLNYIYFGCLLIVLSAVHLFHLSLVEAESKTFYIIHSIGECLFEVALLALITTYLQEKVSRLKNGFIVFSIILVVCHLIDFPLMRTMDMSVWDGFKMAFTENVDNFLEILQAGNIEILTFLSMILGVSAICLTGIVFFSITDRLSLKYPLHFSYKNGLRFSGAVLSVLMLNQLTLENNEKLLQTLPWKSALISTVYPTLELKSQLPSKPEEPFYERQIEPIQIVLAHKPNIYLFITESLRNDYITPDIAPTLCQFRTQEISPLQTVSASNSTHQSWFSIFHGVTPFCWEERQPKKWSMGSLPLQLFKKAGYQIHVLSSSRLSFYKMGHILFGQDQSIANSCRVFPEEGMHPSYVYDAQCIDALTEHMSAAIDRNLFIVFLEGTHFDYSWPPDLTLPSRPIVDTIDYLSLSYSQKNLEGIKNRYRHAIHHIDHLFHHFLTALAVHPKQEEAVVVFTADHGEEFFEEGRIFHASNLNPAQTQVPIYFRLPSKTSQTTLCSHLDIFPTLLDHVFGQIFPWFDGESILRPRHKPYLISTRYNASHNPYEFLMTTEEGSMTFRFKNRSNIHASKFLELISQTSNQLDQVDELIKDLNHPRFREDGCIWQRDHSGKEILF